MSGISPISPFIADNGVLVLDGGFATELETRGFVLDTRLWSAQLLLTNPEAVRDVHLAYLESGADCIITASYQASVAGLRARGMSEAEAAEVLMRSVELATEAREIFLENATDRDASPGPLVAGSIGPYGASLADGSEFIGHYGLSKPELRAFHIDRWDILASSSVDLLACETIPSIEEAEVLLGLLMETPDITAWFSFSCRDGEHISDGTPIRQCAALLDGVEQVAAIGINCTAPSHISSLIAETRGGAPRVPIVVYPN